MDSKKSTARVAKDVRSSTSNAARSTERSQILTKRPSAPPPSLVAKKRERSSLPPPLADNDNDVREEEDRDDELDEAPRKAAPAPLSAAKPAAGSAAVSSLPRTRLPTGSLHTEARTPAAAETIKQRLTTLMNTQLRLGELKRSSQKHFYEIGELLHRIRDQRLYEVKGYSSLEAFIEREVNLGQTFCMQSVRIFETFLPAAVQAHGFHRLATALEALEPSPTSTGMGTSSHGPSEAARMARSPIPPHKL
ncbi:MAG: histone protein [Myxococcaceae bacterium]|nr:histone protein [Myxococcaceae bacterium]